MCIICRPLICFCILTANIIALLLGCYAVWDANHDAVREVCANVLVYSSVRVIACIVFWPCCLVMLWHFASHDEENLAPQLLLISAALFYQLLFLITDAIMTQQALPPTPCDAAIVSASAIHANMLGYVNLVFLIQTACNTAFFLLFIVIQLFVISKRVYQDEREKQQTKLLQDSSGRDKTHTHAHRK